MVYRPTTRIMNRIQTTLTRASGFTGGVWMSLRVTETYRESFVSELATMAFLRAVRTSAAPGTSHTVKDLPGLIVTARSDDEKSGYSLIMTSEI